MSRPRAFSPRLAGVLAACVLGAAPALGAVEGSEPPEPALIAGDSELARRLVAESGADQALPGAGFSEWAGHLLTEGFERLFEALGAGFEALAGTGALWGWLGLALAVLAVLALLWRLAGAWVRRRRARPAEGGGEGIAEDLPAPGPDPAAWRREVERRIAEGRLPEALEAAWWWLATHLAPERPDPAWTNRELLDRTGTPTERRRRLEPLLGWLDRLAYGPGAATLEDVRALVADVEAALA